MRTRRAILPVVLSLFACSEPCTDQVTLVSGFQIAGEGVMRLASVGSRVVMTVDGNLWSSDGTFDGTLALPCTQVADDSWARTDRLYALCAEGLVSTDGTPAGTTTLAGTGSEPTVYGGELWFRGGGSSENLELWRSDGTPQGTRLAVDLALGSGSEPRDLTVALDTLFFSANDGEHGRELWRTDGTPAGASMVDDLEPGEKGSEPHSLTAAGPRLVFLDSRGHLWASNGNNTFMVAPIGLPEGARLTAAGDRVFYDQDGKLWFTEGFSSPVEVGTWEVGERAAAGGWFYFIAPLYGGGSAIWRTDGTPATTRPVVNPRSAMAEVRGLQVSSDRLLFWIRGETVMQLWATDLNGGSGRVVADVSSDAIGWDPGGAVVHGSRVWFSRNGLQRSELWMVDSDGTCVAR